MSEVPLICDGPDAMSARRVLVLAPGAGAGAGHRSMEGLARGIAEHGVSVVRFDFPYMRRAQAAGKERGWPPDSQDVLTATWLSVIQQLGGPRRLIIGGRSMGGRIASYLADSLEAPGLVCIGYPFHPPREPNRAKTSHLRDLATPTLIVQGERDPYGSREDVDSYQLSPMVRIVWITDGDHALIPRRRSGRSEAQNLAEAVSAVARFVGESVFSG